MQGSEPTLIKRKPPSNEGNDSSSGERRQIHQLNPPARTNPPQGNSSLLYTFTIILLISASLFSYLFINLKQAGIIRETRKQKIFLIILYKIDNLIS